MSALVLIAEDEPDIATILRAYLEREGLRTVHAADGRTALDLHLALKPDIVLLDVHMPAADGWTVLAEIRRRGNVPVIMLTALDQQLDKLQALRIGADDYIVKPFDAHEVVARVHAVLRRGGLGDPSMLRVGSLEIDVDAHVVHVQGPGGRMNPALTLTEFRLLAHMARQPLRVFSRGELVDACLRDGDALDRTVDTHVGKLRRKLEAAGARGYVINVRSVGYRLGTGE